MTVQNIRCWAYAVFYTHSTNLITQQHRQTPKIESSQSQTEGFKYKNGFSDPPARCAGTFVPNHTPTLFPTFKSHTTNDAHPAIPNRYIRHTMSMRHCCYCWYHISFCIQFHILNATEVWVAVLGCWCRGPCWPQDHHEMKRGDNISQAQTSPHCNSSSVGRNWKNIPFIQVFRLWFTGNYCWICRLNSRLCLFPYPFVMFSINIAS